MVDDTRESFWSRSGTPWPSDVGNRVFLANALHRVGAIMFGGGWDGSEPGVDLDLMPLPPLSFMAAPGEMGTAFRLLNKPLFEKVPSVFFNTLSAEDWERAVTIQQRAVDEIAPRKTRLITARDELVKKLLSGQIQAFLLPPHGGAFSEPLPWSVWNVPASTIESRFFGCRMNPRAPLASGALGPDLHWIFVDGPAVELAFGHGVVPSQAKPRRRRAPTPESSAIAAWIDETCGGVRPPHKSDGVIAKDVVAWVKADPGRRARFNIGPLVRQTVTRYFERDPV